ncbi:MAG TPA: hypothetical protein DHV14_03590 [Micrococcales bacterium]|uniref:Universal stress protein n=1 Tax=Miniimonas arenae TaxID=676201 RepID=A0A5C5BEY7_9MICO|nr:MULTISPECIES: hypothetical protein [Miniimonas]TNU76074.1 hypothetical protein FH969_04575 [Miniimonas arenae]HCX84222.1 hypothetical protein [Micrococcales bacterium]
MPQTVVVLSEDVLAASDVAKILALAGEDGAVYRVLVPTEVKHSVVSDFLDHLMVLDLKEAWEDVTGRNDLPDDVARRDAAEVLQGSVDALEAAGAEVEAATIADDVVVALRAELAAAPDILQVIAVTQPRAVEDTFHRGWADKAEKELGVPVLHFYTGTSVVGE